MWLSLRSLLYFDSYQIHTFRISTVGHNPPVQVLYTSLSLVCYIIIGIGFFNFFFWVVTKMFVLINRRPYAGLPISNHRGYYYGGSLLHITRMRRFPNFLFHFAQSPVLLLFWLCHTRHTGRGGGRMKQTAPSSPGVSFQVG